MIYHKGKKGALVAEVWFDRAEVDSARGGKPDIVRARYVDSLAPRANSVEKLFTILIDLSLSEEDILNGFDKTTRYQALRAKAKDDVRAETFFALGCKDRSLLDRYIAFFNDFARSKGRGLVDYGDYAQFFEAGTLAVRAVLDEQTAEPLAMHCYVVSDGRARLHQSSSLFRNVEDKEAQNRIGRANRFLHLDDILYFKGQGLPWYDLGGWYGGNEDAEKLAINRFKEAFGGERHEEFSYIVPVSCKGRALTFARSLSKALRRK